MSSGHAVGPWLGFMLGCIVPIFMPSCSLCFNEEGSIQCMQFQQVHGCHACDRQQCWSFNLQCPYYGRRREDHGDAEMGDTVPHMQQIDVVCIANNAVVPAGEKGMNWWRYQRVQFLFEDHVYQMGQATCDENNCLIDTLAQAIGDTRCDLSLIRRELRRRHPTLRPLQYLDLETHWRDVIELLGLYNTSPTGGAWSPDHFRITCLDLCFLGSGNVVGDGARCLPIARQNQNHFVPLLRDTMAGDASGAEQPKSSRPEPPPRPMSPMSDDGSDAASKTSTSSTSSDEMSDEEDVITAIVPCLLSVSNVKSGSLQQRWYMASQEMTGHLRDEVTLPMSPFVEHKGRVFRDVHQGFQLPSWHCPFKNCRACDSEATPKINYERAWWIDQPTTIKTTFDRLP